MGKCECIIRLSVCVCVCCLPLIIPVSVAILTLHLSGSGCYGGTPLSTGLDVLLQALLLVSVFQGQEVRMPVRMSGSSDKSSSEMGKILRLNTTSHLFWSSTWQGLSFSALKLSVIFKGRKYIK